MHVDNKTCDIGNRGKFREIMIKELLIILEKKILFKGFVGAMWNCS